MLRGVLAVLIVVSARGSIAATPQSKPSREGWAIWGGATKETLAAVHSALMWLARTQKDDGSWEAGTRETDVGVTGLAVLAFLSSHYTHRSRHKYGDGDNGTFNFGETVKRGLKFLDRRQNADGCIGDPSHLLSHIIATRAVILDFGLTDNPRLRDSAQRAIDYLLSVRTPQSAWSPGAAGEELIATSWATVTLRSGEFWGLAVPPAVAREVVSGVASMDVVSAMDASAKVLTLTVGAKSKRTSAYEFITRILGEVPKWREGKIDSLAWCLGAESLFLFDGPNGCAWLKWNAAMKAALLTHQEQDGSWEYRKDSRGDRWGAAGCVALNTLCLEVYSRSAAGSVYPSCSR